MGHTVERRPRGAGRPPGTRPSHGYRSATHVHVQARLRMQDAPTFTSAAEQAALRRREAAVGLGWMVDCAAYLLLYPLLAQTMIDQ